MNSGVVLRDNPRSIAEEKKVKLNRLVEYLERRTPHTEEELWLLFRRLSLKQMIILNEGIVK